MGMGARTMAYQQAACTYTDSCLSVANVARHAGRCSPDKIALRTAGREMSYAQLNADADRLARALIDNGVRRGDVVSAYLPNCIDYVIVVLAVSRAAAVFSPINPRYKMREVAAIIAKSAPRFIFTISENVSIVEAAADDVGMEMPRLILCEEDEQQGNDVLRIETFQASKDIELPLVSGADHFSLMFTSGTTGQPKGALATHKARMVWVLNASIFYGLRSDDVYLGVMPQVHSAGLTFTLMHLYVGGTIEILREFDPVRYLELIESRAITSSLAVPTIISMVIETIRTAERKYDLGSLRRLLSCGAPLPPVVKERTIECLTPYLYDYYGSTESNSMTVLSPADQLTKGASVGRPFWNCRVKVLSGDGEELAPGEIGDIWCCNPSIMTEYLNDPEATNAVFNDGWYRTGDLGYLDEDGFLYLSGREKDVIISGGVNIYPREIELVLREHPDILDAAVVGTPDEKWGEVVSAYLVARKGAEPDLNAVQAWVKNSLADYKKPRRIMYLPELPKNAGGKTVVSSLPEMTAAS